MGRAFGEAGPRLRKKPFEPFDCIKKREEAVVFGQRVPLLEASKHDASTVLVRPENLVITEDDSAINIKNPPESRTHSRGFDLSQC